MRILFTLIILGLVTALPAAAQSCRGDAAPNGPKRLFDRSWIRSNAILYGADVRGPFKLSLGANGVERIGGLSARQPERFHLSPKKRWLEYGQTEPLAYWLYDTRKNQTHRLDVQYAAGAQLQFSPDESRIAWLERRGTDHGVAVLDLDTMETHSIRLLNAPDPKAIFFDLTWSMAGDRLTYAWRDAEREDFFSVDPVSGIVKSIPAPREYGADEFVEGAFLLGTDVSVPEPVRANKDDIALERGAHVRYANRKITVSRPRRRTRTIAEQREGCSPPALLDAFENRYVLYRTGDVYWLYGLRENRKAILFHEPTVLDW